MIISLDGNIGAGKTTLLEAIRLAIPDVEVVTEPVGEWTTLAADGKSLLAHFYEDKKRWAYTFQTCALMSRVRALRAAIASTDKLIITERSVLTDRFVFARMLRESGALNDMEWELYTSLWTTLAAALPVSGIIYLTTSVKTSAMRIAKRGREGETMSLEYLTALDDAHQRYVAGAGVPVLRLDTETPLEMNLTAVRAFIGR